MINKFFLIIGCIRLIYFMVKRRELCSNCQTCITVIVKADPSCPTMDTGSALFLEDGSSLGEVRSLCFHLSCTQISYCFSTVLLYLMDRGSLLTEIYLVELISC